MLQITIILIFSNSLACAKLMRKNICALLANRLYAFNSFYETFKIADKMYVYDWYMHVTLKYKSENCGGHAV